MTFIVIQTCTLCPCAAHEIRGGGGQRKLSFERAHCCYCVWPGIRESGDGNASGRVGSQRRQGYFSRPSRDSNQDGRRADGSNKEREIAGPVVRCYLLQWLEAISKAHLGRFAADRGGGMGEGFSKSRSVLESIPIQMTTFLEMA